MGPTIEPLPRGEQVQLLAQRVERDLEVLDDRVRLVLLLEGVLPRVADGVLGDVVEVADARRLAGVDELLAGLRDEEGLHELLRHRDVEEVALLRCDPSSMRRRFSLNFTFASERMGISTNGFLPPFTAWSDRLGELLDLLGRSSSSPASCAGGRAGSPSSLVLGPARALRDLLRLLLERRVRSSSSPPR